MTLSSDVLLIGFGALLVFTGILGGGFELKDLKVGRVPAIPRVVAGVAGALLILMGIGMAATQPSQNPSQASAASPSAPAPSSNDVSYKVSDTITQGGVTEQVVVTVEGRPTTLNVSADYPKQETSMTSHPGTSAYTIDSQTNFSDGQTLSLSGQGTIEISQGKTYDVEIHGSGGAYTLVLVEL